MASRAWCEWFASTVAEAVGRDYALTVGAERFERHRRHFELIQHSQF